MDPLERAGPLSLSDRIGIARELLNMLKDATRLGQRHLMHRALDILHATSFGGPSVNRTAALSWS
jgi:hypothetical protein